MKKGYDDLQVKMRARRINKNFRKPYYIVQAMYRMYQSGPDGTPCTLKDVAKFYKVSYQNIQNLFRRRGFPLRGTGARIHKETERRKRRRPLPPKVHVKVDLLPSPTALRLMILWEKREKKKKTGDRGVFSDII